MPSFEQSNPNRSKLSLEGDLSVLNSNPRYLSIHSHVSVPFIKVARMLSLQLKTELYARLPGSRCAIVLGKAEDLQWIFNPNVATMRFHVSFFVAGATIYTYAYVH